MLEILTGVLQGLTEFLPISSSGHLVIISSLSSELDLNTNDIAFLHIGTLFSIVFFYRKRIFEIFEDLDTFVFYFKIILAGIIPAVLIGLLTPIQNIIDESPNLILITGASYLIFSLLLIFSGKINNSEALNIREITVSQAFVIGIAQSIALLPGVSRSGVTLLTAIYLGVKKADAIYYSLLLGIPTIFGAWSLTFINDSFQVNTDIVLPTIVAMFTGLLAIRVLINFTTSSKLQYFGYYCLLLSMFCFITN
ncbi:undecaprenyl-diphosphate phosphatase [Acidimicrobiaceae bacterium]|nr:undecaprenyl-diphosphate phosphatase [Acidimicrobiaceae bacterium]MDC2990445.1 undecaprenyl-diphosphate phosphatase [Acidimicrobiaceae bacterium]